MWTLPSPFGDQSLGSNLEGVPISFLTALFSLGRLGPVTLALSGGDPRGLFSLDGATGLLQTLRPLDRELLGPVLELEVRAGSGVPPAFAVARVRVLLDDVNDNSPAFPAPEDTVGRKVLTGLHCSKEKRKGLKAQRNSRNQNTLQESATSKEKCASPSLILCVCLTPHAS